jgi:cell cycle sensor histidine kinase DivJ
MRNPLAGFKTKFGLTGGDNKTDGTNGRHIALEINAYFSAWIGAALFPSSIAAYAFGEPGLGLIFAVLGATMLTGYTISRAKGVAVAQAVQALCVAISTLSAIALNANNVIAAIVIAILSATIMCDAKNKKMRALRLSVAAFSIAATFAISSTAPVVTSLVDQFASAGLLLLAFAHLVAPLWLLSRGANVRDTDQMKAFRFLVESVRDAVAKYDAEGNLVYLSHTSENLFGCKRFSLLGGGFMERVHLLDRPRYLKALSDVALSHVSQNVDVRMRCDHEDGSRFTWLEVALSAVPERTSDTGRAEVIAIIRDITSRKQQETDLEEAKKLAETASQAKSRFLATIGHELRTPLNAVVGFSDMMLNDIGGELTKDHREYVELIRGSGAHLLDTVTMLLDMSKLEAGKFEIQTDQVVPQDLIDPCFSIVKSVADKKGVVLSVDAPQTMPSIVADERACRQILINLLSNAIKFSEKGQVVKLSLSRRGKSVLFSIADQGIGISKADIERLGEPFFQAQSGLDRKFEGTGLGLSIVKGLVALHDGELRIESEEGVGTTMTIELPIDGPVPSQANNVLEDLIDRRFMEEERRTHIETSKKVG